MKIIYTLIFTFFIYNVNAQFSTCSDTYVICYKDGTSCTASNYNFYTINATDGTMSPTPFYTLTDNTKEINGFGVNSNDLKLYGIMYDRSLSCTFSNFRLFKIDGGVLVDLGGITPPTDGVNTGNVEGAFGCITLNGDFIFRANITIDGVTYSKIGKIDLIQNLTPQSQIAATYSTITSSFTGRNYADWAVHPVTGDLYTYTIQTGASGVATNGQMAKLDLTTMSMNLVGNVTNGVFLDALRDNFGGIMFGDNGKMYGVNVYTRRLYEINSLDGTLTYLNTIPSSGGGQIRTDLGSCKNGSFLLNLDVESFSGYRKNNIDEINLITLNEKNITTIDIESSEDGLSFRKISSFIPKNTLQRNFYTTSITHNNKTAYYRIKIGDVQKSHYSNIIKIKNNSSAIEFKALEITSSKQSFVVNVPENSSYTIQYHNAIGQSIYHKTIILQKGIQNIEVNNNVHFKGIIAASISNSSFLTTTTFPIIK